MMFWMSECVVAKLLNGLAWILILKLKAFVIQNVIRFSSSAILLNLFRHKSLR